MVHKDIHLDKERVGVAVITFSDTRDIDKDLSGKYIVERITQSGFRITTYTIVREDRKSIHEQLQKLINSKDTDVIITTGGTGISKRDVTPDVVRKIIDREITGFGEIFRYLSYKEIGTHAIVGRVIAGIVKNKIIICLPGSLNAVKLGIDKIILKELEHMLWEVNK